MFLIKYKTMILLMLKAGLMFKGLFTTKLKLSYLGVLLPMNLRNLFPEKLIPLFPVNTSYTHEMQLFFSIDNWIALFW